MAKNKITYRSVALAHVAAAWLRRLVPNSEVQVLHLDCRNCKEEEWDALARAEKWLAGSIQSEPGYAPRTCDLLFGLHVMGALRSWARDRLLAAVRSCRALGALPSPDQQESESPQPGRLQKSDLLPAVNLLGQCRKWRDQDPNSPFQHFFISLGQERQRTWVIVLGMQDLDRGQGSSHSETSRSRSRSRGGLTHCSPLTSPSEEDRECRLEEDSQTN